MNRKIYILPALFIGIVTAFSSCLSSNDESYIDEAWMWRNINEFDEEVTPENNYKTIRGISDPAKSIGWKESAFCMDPDFARYGWTGSAVTDPVERAGMRSAIFSDTIKVRYDGWYKDAEGKKIIFDSTERPTSYNKTSDPNKVARIMRVGDLIDGWRVALYRMKEGDEWRIVVPYQLGYGLEANGNIPGCTTLYFDIKLLEITSKNN